MGPAQRDARGEASRPSPRVKSEPDGQRETDMPRKCSPGVGRSREARI